MFTWKAPKDVSAVVVLIDGCLSTYKIIRGDYNNDHRRELEMLVSSMDGKYFSRQSGKITVVGKMFLEWKDSEAWVRTFKAHPDEDPLFYTGVYDTNQEEYMGLYHGTFKIPVGEKTQEDYVPQEGEFIFDRNWDVYKAPEMRG